MIRFSRDFPALTGIFLYRDVDFFFRIYLKRDFNLEKLKVLMGTLGGDMPLSHLPF